MNSLTNVSLSQRRGTEYLPREQTIDTVIQGGDVDVLLCQPLLTLRIPYGEQDAIVQAYFNSMSASRVDLLGDDPYEPNNALLQLASTLRCHGLRVALLDFHQVDLYFRRKKGRLLLPEDIADVLSRFSYKIMAISSVCVSESHTKELAQLSKSIQPESPVVVGGAMPDALPGHFVSTSSAIDQEICGNSVATILSILSKAPRHGVDTSLRLRAFDLVPSDIPLVPRIFTEYGCKSRCAFCTPCRTQQYLSCGDPDERSGAALNEMRLINSTYGARFFVLGTLSFLQDSRVDHLLCANLAESDLGFKYWCQMRLDDITVTNARLLRDSGCIQVAVGIESANPESIKYTGKGYSPHMDRSTWCEDVKERLALLKEHDLSTYGYFVIGLPGETHEMVDHTKKFIDGLLRLSLLDGTHISVPVPYPGTAWFSRPDLFSITIHHHDYSRYWMNCDPLGYGLPVISTKDIYQGDIYRHWKEALDIATRHYQSTQEYEYGRRLFNHIKTAVA